MHSTRPSFIDLFQRVEYRPTVLNTSIKQDEKVVLIDDVVYGQIEIQDQVLIDLLECDAMKRLDGVLQHGITDVIESTPSFSRLDHSIGAMLLVRQCGASIAEQAAALLHDVSHAAFSHVIDYAFQGKSYHEVIKHDYVYNQTSIPLILKKHGFDPEWILNEEAFSLLEQPAPLLCADRVDYGLRDALAFGFMTVQQVHSFVNQLHAMPVHPNTLTSKETSTMLVCSSLKDAHVFAMAYKELDSKSYREINRVGMYEYTARVMKHALDHHLITESDLYTLSDHQLWHQLQSTSSLCMSDISPHLPHKRVVECIHKDMQFIHDSQEYDVQVSCKVRQVDPLVLNNGVIETLSECSDYTIDKDHRKTVYNLKYYME